jgi:hypothetical protein
LRWIDHAGLADPLALAGSNGTRVNRAFDRVGSIQLTEEREQHGCRLLLTAATWDSQDWRNQP